MALLALATIMSKPAYAYGAPAAGFMDLFEYKFDVDTDELFPSKDVKQDVLAGHSRDFAIGKVDRQVMGFSVKATDVRIHVLPTKIDSGTRLDVEIAGKNVAIDSGYMHKKYGQLQVGSIYGVYNSKTDRVTVHVPFSTALSLLFLLK
jgi:hypothetical protein